MVYISNPWVMPPLQIMSHLQVVLKVFAYELSSQSRISKGTSCQPDRKLSTTFTTTPFVWSTVYPCCFAYH